MLVYAVLMLAGAIWVLIMFFGDNPDFTTVYGFVSNPRFITGVLMVLAGNCALRSRGAQRAGNSLQCVARRRRVSGRLRSTRRAGRPMFGGPVARGLSQCGRGDGWNESSGGKCLSPARANELRSPDTAEIYLIGAGVGS